MDVDRERRSRRRNNRRSPDSSDTEPRANHGSRVSVNRSRSIPRKYMSKSQLDRQIRAAVEEAFYECREEAEGNRRPRTDFGNYYRSDNEAFYGMQRRRHPWDEERSRSHAHQRSLSVDSKFQPDYHNKTLNILYRREPKKTKCLNENGPALEVFQEQPNPFLRYPKLDKKQAVGQRNPETLSGANNLEAPNPEGPLQTMQQQFKKWHPVTTISNFLKAMIRLCFLVPTLITNWTMLQALDRFFTRLSKSCLLSLGLFLVFFLVWAHEFGEPVARIREALGDLFKDRSRSWWAFV